MKKLALVFLLPSISFSQNLQEIKVCSQAGFIPFESKNARGEWEGFDIELIKLFAEDNNIPLVRFIDMDMDGLIPSLLTKKCDLIASGLTVTPERAKSVTFSDPVFQTTLSLAVPLTKSDKNLSKPLEPQQFDKTGNTIAVHDGTAASFFAKSFFKSAKINGYKNQTDMVNSVLNRKATAFIEDDFFVTIISKNLNKEFNKIPLGEISNIAVAFHPENQKLKDKFNSFLKKIRKNKVYEKLLSKYFGFKQGNNKESKRK